MPRLVPCHCDPSFNDGRGAMAVCPTCERKQLHALLLRRGAVQDNPLVAAAFDALAASYGDETDREYDRAEARRG